MEEKKKMSKEDQIKIIDDLIEGTKKLQDTYNKAIKDLGDSVCPSVIEDLGYQMSDVIRKIAELERAKDRILNQGLGNEYAEQAFGIRY